ncbi:dienelactone hydrolase [Inhella inkyongensis]|uniref:Dienelactone hydrolase n=1 Tax=Inhella inkyongensis TaxID=392593 RepID=A0A840S5F4_9BURK|nr:dienelactone hydrolase family protein [Inhella inkyongensis]MBB5204933.1 dienelactone hydrolase [Inhella inkyongensis]
MTDDPMHDFQAQTLSFDDQSKRVWIAGQGPGVIVMPEMPGISPAVLHFARRVRDAGFRVYLPSLFGRDGARPDAESGMVELQRACISAEFRALGGGRSSPITAWLRALARRAHGECGGPGVGAVGMCFTGNFALSMMLEPALLAPVLCQPSLPFDNPQGLEISTAELQQVRDRLEREHLTVRAYRFAGDRHCRAERFAAYAQALGPRFEPTVLPDSAARRTGLDSFFGQVVGCPHSVLTAHLIDAEGEPTRAALDSVLSFLRGRLAGTPHQA